MAIARVWIEDGCISCGACVDEAPEVFEMEEIAVVKPDVNVSDYEDLIIEAIGVCPVEVIKSE